MQKSFCLFLTLTCCAISVSSLFFPFPSQADDDTFALGIEGFYDRYREPDPNVTINGGYGSLTGSYMHDWDGIFGAIDGRFSYGDESYKSPSGSEAGNPQIEVESRLRVGADFAFANGTLLPYIGVGARLYWDDGKHRFTNLGYFNYDRRIDQVYAPIGVTYSYATADGWTITPTVEVDPLIWGRVNSRFQEYGGPNIYNTQHDGYGLRGELMIGNQPHYGSMGWQAGPFVRYWNMGNSDHDGATGAYEPYNTRLQVGMALRMVW